MTFFHVSKVVLLKSTARFLPTNPTGTGNSDGCSPKASMSHFVHQ